MATENGAAAVEPAKPHWAVSVGRTISSFPALIAAVLVLAGVLVCRHRIAEPDIWWHLRNAQYLVANLRLPNIDTYSFTTAGAPWMNHEWLSELFYYAAFQTFGLRGVFAVFTVLLSAFAVVVFWLSFKESGDPLAAGITTAVGGILAMVGFGPRTQHFGWMCFLVMYAILLRFRSTRQAPLWVLPPVFCLWINFHGSWLIGLMVYAIFVVAGLVHRDVGYLLADSWSRSDLKKLGIVAFASVAALFVNPYGYRLVLFPFDLMFRTPLMAAHVEEFASVNFHDLRGKIVAALLAAIFMMILAGRKRWRIDNALLAGFVLYAALTYIRFLLLAGIVLPPILAGQLGHLSSYDSRSERRRLNLALLVIVAVALLLGLPTAKSLEADVRRDFPVGVVEYLRHHPQEGRMLNPDAWGGYLEWNLPELQTFIDTRVDIYQYQGVLQDYVDAVQLKQSQEILDRYQISYVVCPRTAPLTYLLSRVAKWERVYGDDQAVIYKRTTFGVSYTLLAPKASKACCGWAFPPRLLSVTKVIAQWLPTFSKDKKIACIQPISRYTVPVLAIKESTVFGGLTIATSQDTLCAE